MYICIDLKSFYASVECVERGLDPMTANLVVADPSRSSGTICLAVSPAMKKLGVKNRCRVFEIPKTIDYVTAPPRMQKYIDYAAEIYGVYLKYFSKDDIHVYSIDEVFIDVSAYLHMYGCTPRELAIRVMDDVYRSIGVKAACGIGPNLYLAKIALDITAKHAEDFIGELDERSFRETLWDHRPLTDFWRIGPGTARRLAKIGIFTMGDLAVTDEALLYRMFGIDAEILIDHAWGHETATIADIKNYRSKSESISSGQVLMRDYSYEEAKTIVREMADAVCLQLTDREQVAEFVTLSVGYSRSEGGRDGGTARLEGGSCEAGIIVPAVLGIYEHYTDREKPIRRITIGAGDLHRDTGERQISFFDTEPDPDAGVKDRGLRERERALQKVELEIKSKFGKNAVVKGVNLKPEATGMERNRQIGGHKSGEE